MIQYECKCTCATYFCPPLAVQINGHPRHSLSQLSLSFSLSQRLGLLAKIRKQKQPQRSLGKYILREYIYIEREREREREKEILCLVHYKSKVPQLKVKQN